MSGRSVDGPLNPAAPLPLAGCRVLSLAGNVPGPVAAARLRQLGAGVTKVEPPQGDPLAPACPEWYQSLAAGQEVLRLDLKAAADRRRLDNLLAEADLFITANRPAALQRLSLGWAELHSQHPRLCHVAIVGFRGPLANAPGHDLTYQAQGGVITPPELPRTLLADLAGAERAVSEALALLLARERSGVAGCAEVALAEAVEPFSAPLRYGLTAPGGVLGGALPGYNLYETQAGWIAVAALEAHFWLPLLSELGLAPEAADRQTLAKAFRTRTAAEWEAWATAKGLPITALRDATV